MEIRDAESIQGLFEKALAGEGGLTVEAVEAGKEGEIHSWLDDKEIMRGFRVVEASKRVSYFILTTWATDPSNRYLVVFDERHDVPKLEIHKREGDDLVWSYIPRKQDGRNLVRKDWFVSKHGSLDARFGFPTSLGELEELVGKIMNVADLRARSDAEPGKDGSNKMKKKMRKPTHWKISPGAKGWHWEANRDGGFIAIGWGGLGDLSDIQDLEAFDARFAEVAKSQPGWTREGVRQVWRVRALQPGDKVVANIGTTRVVGIGEVTGPYRFDADADRHGHRVPVNWYDTEERVVSKPGWRRTVIKLKASEFEEIAAIGSGVGGGGLHSGDGGGDSVAVPDEDLDFDGVLAQLGNAGLCFSTEVVAAYLLALQVKRFVLMTGISGTGKTRLALEVAKAFQKTAVNKEAGADAGANASGSATESEGAESGVLVEVKPYMHKFRRITVPADLAVEFISVMKVGPRQKVRVEVPGGTVVDLGSYYREGTNLLQLNMSGAVWDWFEANLELGGEFVLSRRDPDPENAGDSGTLGDEQNGSAERSPGQAAAPGEPVAKPTGDQLRADALVRVAERALDADANGAADSDKYQVVVHVDAEVLADPAADGRCELEEGPALAVETVRRLACGASRRPLAHGPAGELTVGRKTRAVSTPLRRALKARDGTRCAFPGCGCRGRDAHHVQAWAEGGPTVLGNMLSICKRHHTFLHEGGFRVEARGDGTFRFLWPDGRELETAPALRGISDSVTGGVGAVLRERWVDPEVRITGDTGHPEWDGEPVDYDWVLGCLLPPRRQRLPTPPAPAPGADTR